MNWIKVTPETMPPENKAVFVTILYDDEENLKDVLEGVIWSEKYGWNCFESIYSDVLVPVDGEITHWMPYPKPAED